MSKAISPYRLPTAPKTIQKGSALKNVLGADAVECLAHNLQLACSTLQKDKFIAEALSGLGPLGILDRGHHLANVMKRHLPSRYEAAISVILRSLTPPLNMTEDVGLAVFFYLPHVCFVADFGLDKAGNGGKDPFDASMKANYELTKRFSSEFSIRPFLIHREKETLQQLLAWTKDENPHVRRLCSEGTRPRLPWAARIPSFVKNPAPVLPLLETLKDDEELYVRRSVANHLGDIAKDHPRLAFDLCRQWLAGASDKRKWLIRHALRHPAKKGVREALALRKQARQSATN